MKDFHKELITYHNKEVKLPQKDRTEMRKRRDSNRNRLKNGLNRDGEPSPIGCHSQGSYSMKTMIQQPDKDYDIDDGVYFEEEDLRGPKGADKSASESKEMIRKAVHSDSFKRPPEKLKNCVRVYYDEGYHADIPVYRKITEPDELGAEKVYYELASTDWKLSDARAVTDWFLGANKARSPDIDNGGQLPRMVRFLKMFARSRPSWREQIASGFMITALVVEKYIPDAEREDKALYNTIMSIRDRLQYDLEIEHPTMSGEMITKGPDDSRARFLLEKLDWATKRLGVLFRVDCSRKQGLKAWDAMFGTTYFSDLLKDRDEEKQKGENVASAALISSSGEKVANRPVDKRGGGRYA